MDYVGLALLIYFVLFVLMLIYFLRIKEVYIDEAILCCKVMLSYMFFGVICLVIWFLYGMDADKRENRIDENQAAAREACELYYISRGDSLIDPCTQQELQQWR